MPSFRKDGQDDDASANVLLRKINRNIPLNRMLSHNTILTLLKPVARNPCVYFYRMYK